MKLLKQTPFILISLFCLFNLGFCPTDNIAIKDIRLVSKSNNIYGYTTRFEDKKGNTYITHTEQHYNNIQEGQTVKLVYDSTTNVIIKIF